MFATLKISPNDEGPVFVESYTNPLLPKSDHHSACNACRDKKLRCTGDKQGCDRCRAKNIRCTYLSSKIKRSRRRKSTLSPPTPARPASSSPSPEDCEDNAYTSTALPFPSPPHSTVAESQSTTDLSGSGIELVTSSPSLEYPESHFEFPIFDPLLEDSSLLDSYLTFDLTPFNELETSLWDASFELEPPETAQDSDTHHAEETASPSKHLDSAPNLQRHPSSSKTDPFSQNDTSIPKPSTCKCMQTVLSLHEDVETKRCEDTSPSVDHRLSFQKYVLGQCNDILKCKECQPISAITMLIITICERLVTSFQTVSRNCLDKLSDLSTLHTEGYFSDSQKVHIGGYGVDSPQEQSFLIIRVVELQLRGLRGLLTRLKCIAVCSGWEKHISMLRPIDEKTKKTIFSLREVANDVLDGPS